MEWLSCVRGTIEYIEAHLKDDITVSDVGNAVYVSPFLLQKGFSVMTGYGIGEYIRNRRLYQAALDIRNTDKKIIDIALDYSYDTPESFTKAFTRFHGATPTQIRTGASPIKGFLPLKVSVDIQGGYEMDYKIQTLFGFKVIGFEKEFTYSEAYAEIPKFWDEVCEKYCTNIYAGNPPETPQERAITENCIGEYGVCIDDVGGGKFRYLVAGKYCGGDVPEGMALYEFPMGQWAIFNCIGPIPGALQSMNTKIFKEWLPGNGEYELSGNSNVEWYDCINGEKTDADYRSAIWIPVKKIENR